MLDFPSSPTDGQIYGSYLYSGGVWMQNGALLTPTAQARNRIVNPAMQISQEYGNTLVGTNGFHPVDQFFLAFVGATVLTGQRVQIPTPKGSVNRLQVKVFTADAAIAAGDLVHVSTKIEGTRVADFGYGTAAARQAVLRFGWKAPAGTYTIFLWNSGAARSYVVPFTISAGQANTDTEQVFVIPGDVTGTWLNDTGMGLQLGIALAAGTTYQGAASWQGGALVATSAITNNVSSTSNVFELFDVGLYADPQATGAAPPWQMPDEAQELAACQRYWVKSANQIVDTSTAMQSFTLPVPMRVVPTITGGGPGFVVYSGDPMGAGTMAIYQTTRNTIPITYSARM